MPAPVIASMAVKGIFKAGSLLGGLSKMGAKLKEAGARSKSTTTEMKRMTGHARMLAGALTGISVAAFTALMMQAPQLAGSLAKIKTEMMLMAYAVGAKLKPALDAVGTILRGIRTGDWTVIKQGIKDLTDAIIKLAAEAGSVVMDFIFGEGSAAKVKTDFNNWIEELKTAWEEGDLIGLIKGLLWDPAEWLLTNAYEWGYNHLGPAIADVVKGAWDAAKDLYGGAFKFGGRVAERYAGAEGIWGHLPDWAHPGYDKESGQFYRGSRQTGGYIGQTGMYRLHAGESVTMKGSSGWDDSYGRGSSNITINFSGATINASTDEQVRDLASRVGNEIAIRQQSLII